MKKILISLIIGFLFLINVGKVCAQSNNDNIFEAKITKVIEEKEISLNKKTQLYQKIEVKILSGEDKDKTLVIENGNMPQANVLKYVTNDNVYVVSQQDQNGKSIYYIKDYIRRFPLFILFIIFTFLTVFVTGKRGIRSILGMVISFLMIFYSIIPNILNGANPILTVILASIFMIPITFYLSHGFSKKTSISVVATIISIIITGLLATIFIELTKLTGYSSEESSFLQFFKNDSINMKGILLSGIIIGALGVLDDITISQASVVEKLYKTNKNLSRKELYNKAMDVGKDHISSMVNTLILVYAGASLPLFLLFNLQPHSFLEIVNYEIIAEEIVRSLVGSIGLICAVPITTYIASKNCK